MQERNNWGGKRQCAGRKKTCLKKVPYNRRINQNIINILRKYAQKHNMSETEALESAILLQTNIEILQGGSFMKIAIPTLEGKLCSHFGHCESFTFVDVNLETQEILEIKNMVPEEGISCQSAYWIAEQGANLVLAGGVGGRPMMTFAQNGVQVVSGCPELEIRELVTLFMQQTLETGVNTCGSDPNHKCHGHSHEDGHGCHGHH